MYKFKVSKYKNLVVDVGKKGENCLNDRVNITNNVNGPSNLVKASAVFGAFFSDGGNIGIFDVNQLAKKPVYLKAHLTEVSDLDFSPFDDGILASGCKSNQVSLWQLVQVEPEPVAPQQAIHCFECPEPAELIQFHPTVDRLLTTVTDTRIQLWDVTGPKVVNEASTGNIQSVSWKSDGATMALTTKNCEIKVWDPRLDSDQMVATFTGHDNHDKESRVVWLSDRPHIITTGLNKRKSKEAHLWDTRSPKSPLGVRSDCQPATAIWLPLFDPDTGIVFLSGKNDSSIYRWDVNELIQQPNTFDGHQDPAVVGDVKIRGATLVNKRALDVMSAEVCRVLIAGLDTVVPVSYRVPRKSYRDFHSDLFPETTAPYCSTTLDQWLKNESQSPEMVSLDPADNSRQDLIRLNSTFGQPVVRRRPAKVVPLKKPESEPAPSHYHPVIPSGQGPAVIQFEGDIPLQSSLSFMYAAREKEEIIKQQMSERVDFSDDVLPQDKYEGVDPNEWAD